MKKVDWVLVIDDERNIHFDSPTVTCRSSEEAIAAIIALKLPRMISFDHDLGGNDTALKFMQWLIDQHLDKNINLAELEYVQVHSANPIGAGNLMLLWKSFCKECGLQVPVKRVWPNESTDVRA